MKGFLISLVPSIGALFLLWITLRAIFQADRRERLALARFEAEEDRAAAAAVAAAPAAAAAGDGGDVGGTGTAGTAAPASAGEAGELGEVGELAAEPAQAPSEDVRAAGEPKGDGVAS